LLELARNSLLAPVNQARSIAEFVEIIRQYAANIPPGQWIRTTTAWNEANLVEKRLPTALELDAATKRHPMLAQRGGHNGVANSLALQLAGITNDSPNPHGGSFGRTPVGALNGALEGGAVYVVAGHIPPTPVADQLRGLALACQTLAAQG